MSKPKICQAEDTEITARVCLLATYVISVFRFYLAIYGNNYITITELEITVIDENMEHMCVLRRSNPEPSKKNVPRYSYL